jgi:hypothetical protein
MKFLLILPFIVFNLFALEKTATYSDFKKNSTNQTGFRGDPDACMSKYNEFNSYDSSHKNVTGNATYEGACNDVNPNSDKLKILSIDLETAYSGDPACTAIDKKNDGTYAYVLYFITHENVHCSYECNNKNTPPDDSGDYTFDDETCTWVKPCTENIPDGWIAYPMSDGACVPYEGAVKERYSTPPGLICDECAAPPYDESTCISPNILDTSVNPPRCNLDLDGDGIPNDEDPDIDGDGVTNENDGFPNDPDRFAMPCDSPGGDYVAIGDDRSVCTAGNQIIYDNVVYTELIYRLCNATCYGVPLRHLTCDEIGLQDKQKCDTSKNDFVFACNDLSDGSTDVIRSSCTPKENPCKTMFDEYKANCEAPYVVNGYDDCQTNGMIVTYEDFSCDAPPPPSCYKMDNEVLDTSLNKCVCMSGYFRNDYGDCWRVLDENATTEQKIKDEQDQKDHAKDELDKERDTNLSTSILDENKRSSLSLDALLREQNLTNSKLDNLTNNLKTDLNTTNGLLSNIRDTLDGNGSAVSVSSIDDELAAQSDWIDTVKTQFADFKDNVDEQLSGIDQKFNDTKALFSGEKVFTVPSGATNCINFTFHGKQISFDLCTPLQQFAPIVYFVFVLVFMVATFRFTVTHLLKGLE